MATFSDNFVGGDGALGANYDNVNSGCVVFGGQVRGQNTGTINYSTVKSSAVDFTDDHECTVTIAVRANDDFAGPMVRSAGTTADGYILYSDGQNFTNRRLSKVVAGTRTVIGAVNVTFATGDTLTLRAVGATLTWYKNGVLMETLGGQTDILTGQPGLFYFFGNSNATRMDTLVAADVLSITPTPAFGRYGVRSPSR